MVIPGAGLALSVLAAAAVAAPATPSAQSSIRVVAQATVMAKPDRADLELGVTTAKKTATAATAENDRKMERVVAALKKEVGADGEIKTATLNVSPRFAEARNDQASPPILGYTVTNTVSVRVTDIKAVARILDRAFEAGANTVEHVEFTMKDPEAAQNEALRAATTKARARAAAMAEGLGLRVGPVISVSEGFEDEPLLAGNKGYDKLEAGRGRLTPVEPGTIEVTATVNVTFALAAR
jgi:uncharacterized protein YggE